MVTPLGLGVKTNWQRLTEGKRHLGHRDRFDVSDLPSKIAGLIPRGDPAEGCSTPTRYMAPKEQRKNDPSSSTASRRPTRRSPMPAGTPTDEEALERTGVMIGSGIGGLQWIAEGSVTLQSAARAASARSSSPPR